MVVSKPLGGSQPGRAGQDVTKLLITEVTEMHGGTYCVAGWQVETKTMVRPLPGGRKWAISQLLPHGVVPGATMRVRPIGTPPASAFPHRTEDTPIDSSAIDPVSPGPALWFGGNAPAWAPTVADAFEVNVRYNREWNGYRQGVHVPANTRTRSLFGVDVARAGVSLFDDGKLRAYLDDGSRRYNLAVSCRTLRELWRGAGGVDAANRALPNTGRLHVRVGLARPWDKDPDKCYVMINGIRW